MPVPESRIRVLNAAPVRADGEFVLYWMHMYRRPGWNFALDRAVEWARELRKPLVIFEGLRLGYPWASERLHRFILDGMRDNAAVFGRAPVLYYPYLETAPDAGKGLIRMLSQKACIVVTDDFPAFMIPRMTSAAAGQSAVRFEQVDSCGILPMRAATMVFPTAYAFRRFLQKNLHGPLLEFPAEHPFRGVKLPVLENLPPVIRRKWPVASLGQLAGGSGLLESLPIDHKVCEVETPGGFRAGREALRSFVEERLSRYIDDRSEPEKEGGSGLSPYLHFGHVSAHELVRAVLDDGGWSPQKLSPKASGSREGWWGLPPPHEAFLDELVTWRELGFNFCHQRDDYDRFSSLPAWALATLRKHAKDRRTYLYSQGQFESARTHDPLWNAAQKQLLVEGRIHNYLRMLWGKKILEWSESPEVALDIMIELNNRYALDGRDPNSYSGIFWVLGRYDRPWAPERPVFGVIRYMSSENTARKFRVKDYLRRYSSGTDGQGNLLRK